jgi:hypothetical protein
MRPHVVVGFQSIFSLLTLMTNKMLHGVKRQNQITNWARVCILYLVCFNATAAEQEEDKKMTRINKLKIKTWKTRSTLFLCLYLSFFRELFDWNLNRVSLLVHSTLKSTQPNRAPSDYWQLGWKMSTWLLTMETQLEQYDLFILKYKRRWRSKEEKGFSLLAVLSQWLSKEGLPFASIW